VLDSAAGIGLMGHSIEEGFVNSTLDWWFDGGRGGVLWRFRSSVDGVGAIKASFARSLTCAAVGTERGFKTGFSWSTGGRGQEGGQG
jgi:hypothetical protein